MEGRAKLFGHPVHQMLIVFPLGLVATALVFDAVQLITGNGLWSQLSYWMIVAGLVSGLSNRARRPLTFDVGCVIGADFADVQEAQINRRRQEANVETIATGGVVEFRYRHPYLPYRTTVHHGAEWVGDRLMTRLTLAPQEARDLTLRVVSCVRAAPVRIQRARPRVDAGALRAGAALSRLPHP
jgi:hypothetical protein